jgi:thiol-disulfide isomerase/thioredoxin
MEAVKTTTNTNTFTPAAIHSVNNSGKEAYGTSLFIQPKLTIGCPDDIYEKEADAMADKVMRMEMPGPINFSSSKNSVHRKCAHCEEEEKQLQRKESSNDSVSVAPPIVHDVINSSGGRSLDADTRSFMEPHFGYDFSSVKIHDNNLAAKSASSINALAYTSGNNIVFNAGQYNTNSDSGKRLLAHELTHVIQQGNNESSMLRRQQPQSGGTTAPTPKQPAICVQDGTNKQVELKEGTVTAIEYGADWCPPCKPTKIAFEEVCNSLSNTKLAMPVRFFGVDLTDPEGNKTTKPTPPATDKLPKIVIYAGTQEIGQLSGMGDFEGIKEAIIKALNCASQPGSVACTQVTPGSGCTIVSEVPRGTRFKFIVGTANFASGEQTKLEAFAKKIKAGPASTVSILGLASFDGNADINKSLSCKRGFAADAILKKEGLSVTPVNATGGVEGTANDPEFRAVDIDLKPNNAPDKPKPTPRDCKDPALPCVFKPVIAGPVEILDTRENAKAPDQRDKETTSSCQTKLFTIETSTDTTANTKIKHVLWRKLPPPNTRSVIRTANDNQGDQPSGMTADGTVKPKRPSFASLNPADSPIDKVKSGCDASGTNPVWCVPFCSFGEFQMEAWVTWECDPDCLKQTDIAHTGPLKINVKEIK